MRSGTYRRANEEENCLERTCESMFLSALSWLTVTATLRTKPKGSQSVNHKSLCAHTSVQILAQNFPVDNLNVVEHVFNYTGHPFDKFVLDIYDPFVVIVLCFSVIYARKHCHLSLDFHFIVPPPETPFWWRCDYCLSVFTFRLVSPESCGSTRARCLKCLIICF